MTKKRDIIITALFCGFIGVMALGTAFLPKQEISVNEKRTLAKFPKISLEKIINGKWEGDFENYISDHFPARNFFAATDSYYMLYTGRNGSNGIYKGKGGYLLNAPVKCDADKLNANITAVNEFAAKTGIETKLIAVPSAGYIMSDKLPENHRQYNDGEVIFDIFKNLDGVEYIDLIDEFNGKKDDIQLFYKTDHHWTSEGAYLAYKVWAENENLAVCAKEDYTIESADGFFGTTYTKSALWNEKPDTIETWEYPINVTVSIDDAEEYDSMFFKEHLKEMDKYPVFLDGNHGFERIVNNDNPQGKRVLVIKDSYAHCFVPFMTENCSQIDIVDLRYYLDSVSQLTEENEYDEVLVLYGISNLCESNDLSILQ